MKDRYTGTDVPGADDEHARRIPAPLPRLAE
jgi:hypothetical protein